MKTRLLKRIRERFEFIPDNLFYRIRVWDRNRLKMYHFLSEKERMDFIIMSLFCSLVAEWMLYKRRAKVKVGEELANYRIAKLANKNWEKIRREKIRKNISQKA